jgi:hypothetical protein
MTLCRKPVRVALSSRMVMSRLLRTIVVQRTD